MIRLRAAVLAPTALIVAALSPLTHSAATASTHAGHPHAPTAITAPRVGDITLTQLAVTTTGAVTPRLTFSTPAKHKPTVYASVTASAAHRYTARIVVLRRRGDSGAPLTWSFGSGAHGDLEWQVRDVLHQPGVVPGLLDAGADPRAVCTAFGVHFRHVAGPTLALPPSAFGADACLLAAHARQPMPGLQRATRLHIPAGFLNAYPRVAVTVQGSGSVVGPVAGIACGARCSGYVRAGHGGVLTPLPANGWTFGGWKGACTGAGVCAVAGSAPFSAIATFTPAVTAPGSPSASPSPSAAALPKRTGAQLYEFVVHLSYATVAAGEVQIVAGNVGMDDHQLSIRDSHGTVLDTTPLLHPHDEATLDVALAPGTYSVFCPTGNHESLGMIATLTVE